MNRLPNIRSRSQRLSIAITAVCLGIATIAWADDPSAPDGDRPIQSLLKNGGIEEIEEGGKSPSSWKKGAAIPGVRYKWDRSQGHDGKSSLCLHKTANRYFPIAQWHQTISNSGESSKLKVSAWIKAEKAAKGIVDVLFASEKGMQGHQWVAFIGAKNPGDPPATHDWQEYTGVVEIPKGITHIAVALQIYGPGTLWFDDLRAEFVPDTTPKTNALSGNSKR